MKINWQGECFKLLAEKAVFWPARQCLFIADTHFGKAATFRSVGIPLPELSTHEDCTTITGLIRHTDAKQLVVLGDFLHAKAGRAKSVRDQLIAWRSRHPQLNIHLVRGNHDNSAGDPWSDLDIECHDEPWNISGINCLHAPSLDDTKPQLAGHLHPAIRISERFGSAMKLSCFWIRPMQIVLPAFGSLTGTSVVNPQPGDLIYATDGKELVQVTSLRTH